MINILCVGDVVGSIGCGFLRERLPGLKKQKNIGLCIVNGENSADGNGITSASLRHILDSGADVITTGNHCFRRKESYPLYDSCDYLLRPANLPDLSPGHGMYIADLGRVQVAVLNLMGTVFMESLRSPFEVLDQFLNTPDLPKLRIKRGIAREKGSKFFCFLIHFNTSFSFR